MTTCLFMLFGMNVRDKPATYNSDGSIATIGADIGDLAPGDVIEVTGESAGPVEQKWLAIYWTDPQGKRVPGWVKKTQKRTDTQPDLYFLVNQGKQMEVGVPIKKMYIESSSVPTPPPVPIPAKVTLNKLLAVLGDQEVIVE